MTKIWKSIFITVLSVIFAFPKETSAISKLDFFIGPTDWSSRLEQLETIANQKIQGSLQDMSKILKQASVGEGRELALVSDEYVNKEMNGLLKELGMAVLNGNFSMSMVDAKYKELLANNKHELANAQSDYDNLILSLQQAKNSKNQAIIAQITELRTKLAATKDPDEIKELEEQIAILEGQRIENNADYVLNNPELHAKKSKIIELSKLVGEAESAMQLDVMRGKGEEMINNLFDKKVNEEDEKNIYEEKLGDLFLKEDEERTSENMKKVNLEREREFYYAVQNILKTTMDNNIRTVETELRASDMTDKSMKDADGLFGAKGMHIGVDVQMAKSAAHLMSMLLGELRYKSLAKMRGWNNKYKLVDYTHDVTELDLDYYELDGASIQNIKRSVDSIKNGTENLSTGFEDMWHGF